ncbi:metal ABC transporter permease [Marinobacter oulmenensis]|uniref:Zinc/manganese transport system permease protein n=1 Tax=Marinobacter oulmenensis TaxID=643747 RepID=A0A840U9Q1_9GAMM|nr:metal ABC transporter permease [Marinobacter oulmenensis]MBB5319860.1 zinc/manganese transport system permease protein [Marinobacter oulmenensis]
MAELGWLLVPVSGGVFLALLLVPLGFQVIARGAVFADLAIAQWAALGALVGHYLPVAGALAGISPFSLLAGLASAWLVHRVVRQPRRMRQALIGILYVAGANLAILVVSSDPHGAQALHRAASGDLLWAGHGPVLAVAVLALLVWALMRWQPGWLAGNWFMPVFAVAVTWSVALAGIYVVFALLIITPLLQGELDGRGYLPALVCAVSGVLSGIALSVLVDLPVGPAIVLMVLLISLLAGAEKRVKNFTRRRLRLH